LWAAATTADLREDSSRDFFEDTRVIREGQIGFLGSGEDGVEQQNQQAAEHRRGHLGSTQSTLGKSPMGNFKTSLPFAVLLFPQNLFLDPGANILDFRISPVQLRVFARDHSHRCPVCFACVCQFPP
jgi:hypothetical protein